MKLLVGGDPEIFLQDKNTGAFVSATEFNLPGTKRNPHKVKCGAIQVDGTALEINIDPAETKEQFSLHLKTVLNEADGFLPRHIQMSFTPAIRYEPKYYDSIPAAAKELGCDPDYKGTTGAVNEPPKPDGTLRTASGHITLGWTEDQQPLDPGHFYDCRHMSLRLDNYFSIFSSFWEIPNERKRLYGAGAAFRPKPFGVEYRAMSNAWVGRPELWNWVFDSTKWIFNHVLEGNRYNPCPNYNNAHNRKILGLDKDNQYIYDDYKNPFQARIRMCEDIIYNNFYDRSFPKFPADFKPVSGKTDAKLAKDIYGRPING